MRRSLAAVVAGVLVGSLLTSVEIWPSTAPMARALSNSDCTPVVTLSDNTDVGGDDSYVEVSTVDADSDGTDDECVIKFVKPSVEMLWDTSGYTNEIDYLVVAGGGEGSLAGGGAGGLAEGLRSNGRNGGPISTSSLGDTTKVFVGDGGSGGSDSADLGNSGEDSYIISQNPDDSFDSEGDVDPEGDGEVRIGAGVVAGVVMKGGGGGAGFSSFGESGAAGGSSGGSSSRGSSVSGTLPLNNEFGSAGGDSAGGRALNGDNLASTGGGGGAGGPGGAGNYGSGCTSDLCWGDGGPGYTSSITGTNVGYAGGGVGGGQKESGNTLSQSASDGGGNATSGTNNVKSDSQNGKDGTGGGGGGFQIAGTTSGAGGGDGGSGVVIVRFELPAVGPVPELGAVSLADSAVPGFVVTIENYYSSASDGSGVAVNWSATATGGASASVSSSGVVSVVFADADVGEDEAGSTVSSTVTVTATAASDVYQSVSAQKQGSGVVQDPLSITGSDDLRFGGSITVAASGGSGSGAVTLGLDSASVTAGCELSGSVLSTGSADATDSCVVTATRAGDANFIASTQATKTFAIGKADRFVSFTSSVPADPVAGDTYTPTATATGGLPVTFSATGECSLTSGVVTFSSVGTCTITAASSGTNTNYEAATDVTQSIVVGLANQTITFDAVGGKDFDDRPFQLSATSSRGLEVSFATSSDACSVTSAGVVSIDDTGLCEITASQSGVTGQIAAASDVTRSFRVQAVVPGAPRLTSVGFGDGSLTVGFIAPDYVGGGMISAYRAVATDGDGNQFVNNSCGTSSPCTVSGLTNGTDYTVTVAAVNEAGVGPVSNTSPAMEPVSRAAAVSALSTVPGDGSLAVSWTKPDLGGATFTSYEVTVLAGGVSVDSASITDSENTTQASFSGLINGTTYDVKVVTITSANGTEVTGNTATTEGVPAVAPSAVRDAAAVLVGNTGAFVSWAAPVSDGGLPVTSYEVSPSSLSCEFDNALDQFCDITGLARGRTVSISIAAVNGIGAGQTVTVSVTTPALPSSGGSDDDDEETVSPVPSATPAPVAGPGGPVGRPGPGIPPRAPGGGPGGGPGAAPAPPGGTAGSPVPPDRPGATVGGVPVPATTTASPGGRGVSVSAGGVDVGVDVPDPGDGRGGVIDRDGTPEPVVTPGQGKSISGAGAAPGSVVDVWLPGRGTTGPTNIATIPVAADGSFSADVNLFAGSDEPLPIGRNVVQIVTTNADGEEILVDMPFTLAQGTPVPEVLRETGTTPDAPTVGIINTNKGDPTVTRVISVPDQGIVSVESDTWAFTVGINTETGTVDGTDTDTVIRTGPNTDVTVSGSGFMPDTRVDIWAFSDPTLLGNATVAPDGTVSVTVAITPQALEVGAHTLQLQAVGQDGFIRTSNLPVEIEATQVIATTSDGAGTLLWWILSIAIAVILIALLVTVVIRRRQA